MSIVLELKELALDVCIMYHPKVMLYKRQAKKLHKELKPRGFSLMNCQDIVIKGVGFNHWHHFISILKKDYALEINQQKFKLTDSPVLDGGHVLLGHDINFNHYKWHNEKEMRAHQLIIGQDLHKDYDLFLMGQVLKQKKQVNMINPGSRADLDKVISLVESKGRISDLRVFDLSTDSSGTTPYQAYLNGVFECSSKGYIISLFDILRNLHLIEDSWHHRFLILFSAVISCLVELRDKGFVVLDLDLIEETLHFENLFHLMRDSRLSLDSRNMLVEYFDMLPGFMSVKGFDDLSTPLELTKEGGVVKINGVIVSETILEHHGYIHMQNHAMMKLLGLTNIFKPAGLQIDRLLFDKNGDNQYVNIFYFGEENSETVKFAKAFVLQLYRVNMSYLLGYSGTGRGFDEFVKGEWRYLYMREMELRGNHAVMAAQSRSLGVSLCISYESVDYMKKTLSHDVVPSLLANTLTAILSEKDKDLIIEEYHVLDSEKLLADEILNLNIFTEENPKGDFWMIKNQGLYQMEYKKVKRVD